jgi:hypothetical protein
MSKIVNDYNESKNYSEDIMKEITDILDSNGVDWVAKSNIEIVCNNQSEDEIERILCDNITTPKIVFMLLVDIVQMDDKIYIRQKIK